MNSRLLYYTVTKNFNLFGNIKMFGVVCSWKLSYQYFLGVAV